MSKCDSRDRRKARKIRSQLLPSYEEAAWVFLCRRFYYYNGRRPVLRPTRSRLYKQDHSPLRPNFDPLGKNSGNVTDAKNINVDRWKIEANPGHLDISSRLSCWLWTDIKELYPQYIQLFSGTRNFFYFHNVPEWNLRLCRIIFFRIYIQPAY